MIVGKKGTELNGGITGDFLVFSINTQVNNRSVLVTADFNGEITRQNLTNLVDDLNEIERELPAHKLLINFAAIDRVSINFADIKEIVGYVKANDIRQGVTAFVTGENAPRYYLVKLYIDLVSFFRPKERKVFKRLDDAVDWLSLDRT